MLLMSWQNWQWSLPRCSRLHRGSQCPFFHQIWYLLQRSIKKYKIVTANWESKLCRYWWMADQTSKPAINMHFPTHCFHKTTWISWIFGIHFQSAGKWLIVETAALACGMLKPFKELLLIVFSVLVDVCVLFCRHTNLVVHGRSIGKPAVFFVTVQSNLACPFNVQQWQSSREPHKQVIYSGTRRIFCSSLLPRFEACTQMQSSGAFHYFECHYCTCIIIQEVGPKFISFFAKGLNRSVSRKLRVCFSPDGNRSR